MNIFNMTLNILRDLLYFLFVISAIFLVIGCEMVNIDERVVYEDETPVVNAKVHQWTDEGYNGYTFTDDNGTWSLLVPVDTIIYLCIENPRNNNTLACYENGYLFTPTLESGSNKMTKE